MFQRLIAMLALSALLTIGCSSTGSDDSTATPEPTRERPRASILPPADPDGPGGGLDDQGPTVQESNDDGRLVVQGSDGQISTMLPDGTEVVELTDGTTTNRQPAWAPDGSWLAWVSVDNASGETSIAIDHFDNSAPSRIPVQTEPFYLYWDPSAARIAHLSPTDAGIDLSITEPFADPGPQTRRIDRGQPYFLAWGPDGDELLVHASEFRLDRIDMADATLIIDEEPARFGAPVWMQTDTIVFADVEDDTQYLVTTGASGEGRRPLVEYLGHLRLTVSNQGNRIIMQTTMVAENDDGVATISAPRHPRDPDAIPAGFQTEPTPTPGFDESLDPIDTINPGIVYGMGIFGGEPYPVSTGPALAMFPSPDGQSVAWFEPIDRDGGSLLLRIDTGSEVHTVGPIQPTGEMMSSYLPFFDQYDLSHDFWSPSSRLFVYASRPPFGTAEDEGIWVFDIETGEATLIAPGSVASFTHTPAAAGGGSIV